MPNIQGSRGFEKSRKMKLGFPGLGKVMENRKIGNLAILVVKNPVS